MCARPYRVFCAPNRRARHTAAFACAAHSYWLDVFPVVRGEVRRLRREASRIPDRALRGLALETLRVKWTNLEGAAAFAAFRAPAQRHAIARLLVGYQAAYDYADTLMEQPSPAPAANGRQLHGALTAILRPGYPQPDYYQHHSRHDDGGYLAGLVAGCHSILTRLPGYPPLAAKAIQSAQRGVEYQARISLASEQDHPALSHWAAQTAPRHSLYWWETWAACGSSLHTLALLAHAADPPTDNARTAAIEELYWPWAGAVHGLLDCMIDHTEDTATQRPNLLDLYSSPPQATERLRFLVTESVKHAATVGDEHSLIVAGMISLYLSDHQAWTPTWRPVSESILAALGELATPALLILRARRLAHHHL